MKLLRVGAISFLFIFMLSCGGNLKQPKLEEFSKIELNSFKKQYTNFSTSLYFHNPNPYAIMVTEADFDVKVNGVDVGSFYDNKVREVKSEEGVSILIDFEFSTTDAFNNLEFGIAKVKSEHVAPVRFVGKLVVKTMDMSKEVEYDVTQKVLFSNDKKLYLDEEGNIQKK